MALEKDAGNSDEFWKLGCDSIVRPAPSLMKTLVQPAPC